MAGEQRTNRGGASALSEDPQAELPELPLDVVVHSILTEPWQRAVCTAAAAHLSRDALVRASHPDLPSWVLHSFFSSRLLNKREQAQLLAARAAAGDLAGVQWLRGKGCAWTSDACIEAAQHGHAGVLAWLLPACPCDVGACAVAAAAGGHVCVLELLRSETLLQRPFDLAACAEAAAATQQMRVLGWLLSLDGGLQRLAAPALASADAAAAARQQLRLIVSCAQARAPIALLRAVA